MLNEILNLDVCAPSCRCWKCRRTSNSVAIVNSTKQPVPVDPTLPPWLSPEAAKGPVPIANASTDDPLVPATIDWGANEEERRTKASRRQEESKQSRQATVNHGDDVLPLPTIDWSK